MTVSDQFANPPPACGSKHALSLVYVNYNCTEILLRSIESVRSNTSIPLEIVVVDNASREAEVSRLEEDDKIRLLRSPSNLGFGKACNLGANQATGEFLAIINPDTIADSNVLDELVAHVASHPEVGLAAPMLIHENGMPQNSWNVQENLLWEFAKAHYLQGLWYRRNWSAFRRKFGEATAWPVGNVVGACMVMRTKDYLGLGGFDPDFFMNGEDGEFCDRILATGLKIHFLPWLTLHHHEGAVQRSDWSNYMTHRFEALRIAIQKRYRGVWKLIGLAMWWEAVLARIVIGFLFLRGDSRSRIRGYYNAAVLAWNDHR